MAQWKKGAKKQQEVEEVEVEEEEEEEEEVVEGEAEEIEEEEPEPEPAPKAKRGKAKPVIEEPEEEEEEVEVEVEEPKAKKGKAAPKVEKTKGAPRARKWNYGITPKSTIARVKGAEAPKGVADQWQHAVTGTTVEAFLKAGGDRHGLRVMMRQGAIKLKTGSESYPRPWDPAVDKQPAPVRKAKAEPVEEEEEEAPAPKKPVKKAKK